MLPVEVVVASDLDLPVSVVVVAMEVVLLVTITMVAATTDAVLLVLLAATATAATVIVLLLLRAVATKMITVDLPLPEEDLPEITTIVAVDLLMMSTVLPAVAMKMNISVDLLVVADMDRVDLLVVVMAATHTRMEVAEVVTTEALRLAGVDLDVIEALVRLVVALMVGLVTVIVGVVAVAAVVVVVVVVTESGEMGNIEIREGLKVISLC